MASTPVDGLTPDEFARLKQLSPADAMRWMQERTGGALTFSWQDLWQAEHSYHFTVSRLARLDLLQSLHESLSKSVAGDLSRRDWMRNAEQIKQTDLVAVAGCYPTASLLALKPLMEAGLIKDQTTPIINAVSGVSGAGRKASMGMIYSENADNFKAYGVSGHRHHPEIVEALENISGQKGVFDHIVFVPHLVPMIRGMLSTIYVDLTDAGDALDLQSLYETFYAHELAGNSGHPFEALSVFLDAKLKN